MSRLAHSILAALCVASANLAGTATAEPQAPPASQAPASEPTAPSDPTEDERRRREIEKLEAEIAGLRLQNEALDVRTRRWSVWLGAVGGITGTLLTFVLGFLGWRLNSIQSRRTQQEKDLSREKLEQDRHLEREKQNLELYRGLGHESPRVQFAAASVLLERLTTYRDRKQQKEELTPAEEIEHPTIIFVLIAVIKERPQENPTHAALGKHIADNLIKALDAVMPAGVSPREASSLPSDN